MFKVPVEDSLVTVAVSHSIWCQFAFICYSANVVPGSKTLWVGNSIVSISNDVAPGIPNEIEAWTETHLFRNVSGDHLEQFMIPDTGPTIPPQGPHFRSMSLSVNEFFAPNENLAAIARIDSLWFDDPSGPVMAIPVPLLSNTEVDLSLEIDASPPVSCP